jgi:hypothetical protein
VIVDDFQVVVQDCSCEVMITMTCGESQSSLMTPVYWPVIIEEDELEAAELLYDDNIDDCE